MKKPIKYKSKLEESVAKQLQAVDATYETVKLKYTIPASEHTYTPDFEVSRPGSTYYMLDGIVQPTDEYFLIECKGGGPRYGLTEETKQKMLLVKQAYPRLDIRFCFSNAKLKTGNGRGKKKITYGEWCDIHGFPYCEQIIPKEWLKGYILK